MKILDQSGVLPEIEALLKIGKKVDVAVAYWGQGAFEQVGLNKVVSNKIGTIVCDLMSGASNPREIKKLLRKFGGERVLTLDQLHAKVWVSDTTAIVGSSNASANGLGLEESETRGLIELNVSITEANAVAAVQSWFKGISSNGRKITEQDLTVAEQRWKQRRRTRPVEITGASTSLYDAVKNSRESFRDRDVYVWVYRHEDQDKGAKDAFAIERKKRSLLPMSDFWQWDNSEPPPPGSYVLDFDFATDGTTYQNAWQILVDDPLVKRGKDTILLCKPASSILGFKLGDVRKWEAAAKRAFSEKGAEWSGHLFKFADFMQ